MTRNSDEPGQVSHQGQGAPPRVLVLLSQELEGQGTGLDLAALREWLQVTLPAVQVCVEPARQPIDIARLVAASEAERLVLGVAGKEYPAMEVQTQVRRAGLDPLGVEIVDLGAYAALGHPRPTAMERAKLLLATAVARTRAFPGSRPEHLKISLSVNLSRRALFTLQVHEYHAVPAVLPHRCAVERGCQCCVEVCPRGALSVRERRIELDKARCEGCGLCLNACPTGALDFPGHSFGEVDARVVALLDPTLGDLAPRGILFLCQQSAPTLETSVGQGFRYPGGWLPVRVPCAGSLSAGLLLRCLALGAAAVGVVGCRDQCRFNQGGSVAERIDFCQEVLKRMGAPADLVKFCPLPGDEAAWALPAAPILAAQRPSPPLAHGASHDPRIAAGAILSLARALQAPPDLTIAHPASPFGVVELDSAGCTACEACTAVCPTHALSSVHRGAEITIHFEAARCTGCGLCVPRCPELERGVLRLQRAVDVRRLGEGPVAVHRDRTLRCQACGAPIAPAAMMTRLAAMLGPDYPFLADTIGRYCSTCRGAPTARRKP